MENVSFSHYTLTSQVLFHIYTEKFSPFSPCSNSKSWFNDSGLGVRRFDPIYDTNGNIIPTFYAAFSDLVALGETIIRHPNTQTNTPVAMRSLNWRPENNKEQKAGLTKGIAQMTPNRELTLIDLQTVRLADNSQPLQSWLQQGEQAYPALHMVSAWFAQRHKKFDGLIWDSYQRGIPGERALVLYGDRVSNSDLQLRNHEPLNTASNLDRIRDAARTLNVSPPEWLIK